MSSLKNIKTLTAAAMLVAVAIILGFFKIPISPVVEIRFGNIPIALCGALFGPGVSAAAGAVSDIGAYLVKPTGPFFPGFTLNAAVSGLIFGLILFKKEITVKRVVLAQLIQSVLVGFFLTGLWLSVLYHMPLWSVLASRALKELVMCPIQAALLLAVLKPVRQIPSLRLSSKEGKMEA